MKPPWKQIVPYRNNRASKAKACWARVELTNADWRYLSDFSCMFDFIPCCVSASPFPGRQSYIHPPRFMPQASFERIPLTD